MRCPCLHLWPQALSPCCFTRIAARPKEQACDNRRFVPCSQDARRLFHHCPVQALVQHALRQALAADAQTLQFKLPPAGVPLPPTHMSPGVASGAPVVEGLAVASLWTVQLLKLLAQVSIGPGLLGAIARALCHLG